jgi:hypothetical protein
MTASASPAFGLRSTEISLLSAGVRRNKRPIRSLMMTSVAKPIARYRQASRKSVPMWLDGPATALPTKIPVAIRKALLLCFLLSTASLLIFPALGNLRGATSLPARAAADRAEDGPPVTGLVEVVNNVLRMHKMLVMAK